MSSNLYKQNIIDHYKNPRNEGVLSNSTNAADLKNASCGDEISVQLLVEDGTIKDVKFKGSGCAISVAGMSMLSEKLIGMKLSEFEKLDEQFILELLGMDKTSPRIKCATIGWETVKKAVRK